MFPIGTYDRFIQKIKGREGKCKPRYLGVLFCDIEQQNVKQFIINYMEVFNKKSGENFDFYIPGYLSCKTGRTSDIFELNSEKYKFNRKVYDEFCYKFSQDFDIKYPYVATLVLLEYKSGNFKHSKKCMFNLEEINGGVKNSGDFFELIFKSAEENDELQNILDNMFKEVDDKPDIIFTVINQITSFFNCDLKEPKDKFLKHRKIRKQYELI